MINEESALPPACSVFSEKLLRSILKKILLLKPEKRHGVIAIYSVIDVKIVDLYKFYSIIYIKIIDILGDELLYILVKQLDCLTIPMAVVENFIIKTKLVLVFFKKALERIKGDVCGSQCLFQFRIPAPPGNEMGVKGEPFGIVC